MIVLLYEIDTDDASAALNIASEIESEMGIQPKNDSTAGWSSHQI